ncbi:MAG: phosphoribosyltransferase family protein [Pseudomonadota bacterium]|nr:phosphoribosyltransferase family protein [Pseudomonadota bacterium]
MMTSLYSASAIDERVKDIAEDINKEFAGQDSIHAVVTLNGAFVFAADLIRHLKVPLVMHFAGATSYFGTNQKDLRINADALPPSFGGKPVLLIEDIVDSGNTIAMLRQIMADRSAGTIRVATLLKRQGSSGVADFYGFTVPEGLFVIGYGMDIDGRYRELPEIQTLGTATSSGAC